MRRDQLRLPAGHLHQPGIFLFFADKVLLRNFLWKLKIREKENGDERHDGERDTPPPLTGSRPSPQDDMRDLHQHLSACLSVFLPVYLSVRLPVHLSTCLTVCLSLCSPFGHLSLLLSTCLSVYVSFCLSICLSFLPSVYLFIYPCLPLSSCLPASQSVFGCLVNSVHYLQMSDSQLICTHGQLTSQTLTNQRPPRGKSSNKNPAVTRNTKFQPGWSDRNDVTGRVTSSEPCPVTRPVSPSLFPLFYFFFLNQG